MQTSRTKRIKYLESQLEAISNCATLAIPGARGAAHYDLANIQSIAFAAINNAKIKTLAKYKGYVIQKTGFYYIIPGLTGKFNTSKPIKYAKHVIDSEIARRQKL